MTTFEELKRRGLLAQLTDEKEIEELVNAGVSPDLVRLSCGLENSADLIDDIKQALGE